MNLGDASNVGQGIAYVALAVTAGVGAWKAHKAEKYAKPTGNGFAKKVTEALERIENKVDHHIQSHADADVARQVNSDVAAGRPRPRRDLSDVNDL